MGHFKYFEYIGNRAFRIKKKQVTSYQIANGPKIKIFDFGTFQLKMKMQSREQNPFINFLGHFILVI